MDGEVFPMNFRQSPREQAIAVSISDSPDMSVLGLSEGHLRDARVGIACYLLWKGVQLFYSGDLRQYGFSDQLFELVARYTSVRNLTEDKFGVTNYLAWPVHIQLPIEKIEYAADELSGAARLICLDIDGEPMTLEERRTRQNVEPDEDEWCQGLTAMRRRMLKQTDARIVLGGRVEGYKGAMPGIAEEALLSLKAQQPLFVAGGFGGCSRDIAETIGLVEEREFARNSWRGRELFSSFSASSLNNGLSDEENATLARTPHIDQAIVLILRGLSRLEDSRPKY